MPRIRTVKPEFFKHEELYSAEQESKLPLRLAFVGLWCVADREGRFKWRPNQIKLDVLPYDLCDFSHVLDALAARGFIGQYQDVEGNLFGYILSFSSHQVINNRESQSLIISPFDACVTRDPRGLSMHKGKGKERKGREEEGKELSSVARVDEPAKETILQTQCKITWKAYSESYEKRYGVEPVRNTKVNSNVKNFVQRVGGDEAPLIASWYVAHSNNFYVRDAHGFGLLTKDAEKLRTEWATGMTIELNGSAFKTKFQHVKANNDKAFDEFLGVTEKPIDGEVVYD
jgi:hypothetical protein